MAQCLYFVGADKSRQAMSSKQAAGARWDAKAAQLAPDGSGTPWESSGFGDQHQQSLASMS